MKRTLFVLTLVVVVGAAAAPAWAHEEINPKQFPTGQPTFLTLNAANEKDADLTKVTLSAPANVGFGEGTRSPAGWTVSATPQAITWTGGAVKHGQFEQWGFEIEGADQPGTLTYKVTLGYGNGQSEDVNVNVTAVAAGTTATTVATPVPAVTTTAAGTTETTAAAEAKSGSGSAARTRANLALGLGVVAVVLSLVALGMAARRRSATAPAADAAGGSERQDW